MKKVAVLLILFGSGLAALGITGFSGELYPDPQLTDRVRNDSPVYGSLDGSLGWPLNARVEIVVGVLSLVGGMILRKDLK